MHGAGRATRCEAWSACDPRSGLRNQTGLGQGAIERAQEGDEIADLVAGDVDAGELRIERAHGGGTSAAASPSSASVPIVDEPGRGFLNVRSTTSPGQRHGCPGSVVDATRRSTAARHAAGGASIESPRRAGTQAAEAAWLHVVGAARPARASSERNRRENQRAGRNTSGSQGSPAHGRTLRSFFAVASWPVGARGEGETRRSFGGNAATAKESLARAAIGGGASGRHRAKSGGSAGKSVCPAGIEPATGRLEISCSSG